MGRPKLGEKRVGYAIRTQTYRRLKKMASERGLKTAELVRQLIHSFLSGKGKAAVEYLNPRTYVCGSIPVSKNEAAILDELASSLDVTVNRLVSDVIVQATAYTSTEILEGATFLNPALIPEAVSKEGHPTGEYRDRIPAALAEHLCVLDERGLSLSRDDANALGRIAPGELERAPFAEGSGIGEDD